MKHCSLDVEIGFGCHRDHFAKEDDVVLLCIEREKDVAGNTDIRRLLGDGGGLSTRWVTGCEKNGNAHSCFEVQGSL